MKNVFAAALVAVTFAPAMAFAQVQPASPPVVTTPAPVTPGEPGHPGERHPEIKKALHHLEEAKKNLQEAAHDYSGHRDQAIQLIDQAEAQLRQGEVDANRR